MFESNVFPNEAGEVEYKVYERMLFNSDRKRMSILIKDPKDGLYKLYTKGADSIILARLDENQGDAEIKESSIRFLDVASEKGLRTLLFAMRVIDEEEFNQFIALKK